MVFCKNREISKSFEIHYLVWIDYYDRRLLKVFTNKFVLIISPIFYYEIELRII
jgi:hypothetical protein